jgi:dolichyl-phosphooligosaccharide-protein glycotransferase
MKNKELYTKIGIIVFIFMLGLFIRLDSIYLLDTSNDEKNYYLDSNGLPYMFELDSYYNYRLTENLIDHGYLGDFKINDTEWDLHSYYPPGVPLDYPPLIAYLAALFYYLINLFANIPLLYIVFWISIFTAPLSGIVAFFLVRRFTNNFGAAAAGIFIVTAPMYALRTVAGWFDTDIFNIFFPLLITLLFFLAIDNRDNLKRGMIYSIAAAFSMFLFSLAWNGYQYIFYFIVLFLALYILWCKFKGRKVKNMTYIFLVFLFSSLVMIAVFSGFFNIYKLVLGPIELIKISNNPWSPWPDVYSTVSELNRPDFIEIISNLGIAFFAGILGYLWILRIMINDKLKEKFLTRMNWFFFLYLLLWGIIGFISLLKGNRFVMLLIPPMAISAGIFIGIVVNYIYLLKNNQRFNIFKEKKNLLPILAILLLVLLLIPAVYNAHQSVSSLKPLVNDDLWSASLWINNNTSNDTVIITQWTYGHLFTAIADRPVVFDGRMGYIETLPNRNYGIAYPYKTNSPAIYREYWINKAFTTNNETLSKGIFNMLATNGDLAYLTLNSYTKNTTVSVEILNNILGVNKTIANYTLLAKYNLNYTQADEVLEYTHPENPRPYVIVTTDGMIGIGAGVFEYGEWDFNKNEGQNYTYFYNNYNISNDIIETSDGLIYDKQNGKLTWYNKTPNKIVTIQNGNIQEKIVNEQSDFNVVLLMDKRKVIIMDKNFEKSLFNKMIVEKRTDTDFDIIYKTNSVVVWQPKK